MSLAFILARRFDAADQQAEVHATLHQHEEMLGGVARVVEVQGAALLGVGEQALHLIQHPLRAGVEEQFRQLRILPALGDHQAAEGDGFRAVDQPVEAARQRQQQLFERRAGRRFGEQLGHLLGALGPHRLAEQRFLVGEVAIDRELRDSSLGGDGFHAAAVVALADEQHLGRLEDGLALGQVLGAARAVRTGRLGHALLPMKYWTERYCIFTIPGSIKIPTRFCERSSSCFAMFCPPLSPLPSSSL
ncbi:hypothetical protein D9M68_468770 [compost metagenome]